MEFTRIEGALFNPLPQKVPMRYSFSLDQKRILMKHYENGMHGQSLAYQDKIVACAQEAGVDFDIVRNWIGNMRRKRRMETAQKNPMSAMMLQHDPSIENKRRFMGVSGSGAFGGPQYFVRHPTSGGQQQQQQQQQQQPHQMVGGVGNQGPPPVPVPTSILRNAPLSTRDQNVTPPAAGPPAIGQQGGAHTAPSTKQEADRLDADRPSCLVPGGSHPSAITAPPGAGGDRFPDETIPVMHAQGAGQGKEAEDLEWRQQQIQRIMQQVQQSVHQLESLSCECVVATVVPSDGGTYITGTPIAVQYFSEIQKIQPMADYVNPASPPSVNSDSSPNDATEEGGHARSNAPPPRNQPLQGGSAGGGGSKDETGQGDGTKDGGDGHAAEGGKDSKEEVEGRDGQIIRAGEEVYIVNKEHYIIGTGTLLPGPHKQIELKNAPL